MFEDIEHVKLHPSENMLKDAYTLHSDFDSRKWVGRESYHNSEHIRASAESADILFKSAEYGPDPLKLNEDLQKWNTSNPDNQIKDINELQKVFRIAFAAHDLGNIINGMGVEDGVLTANFHDKYTAASAEDRSMQFVELIINNEKDIDGADKARFILLAKHIINETRYDPPIENRANRPVEDVNREIEEHYLNVPFARAARVIDQIGNDLFSQNPNRVIGLLEEMRLEKGENTQIDPYRFFNFVSIRFPQLVPDENARKALFKVWNREMPKEDNRYTTEAVSIGTFLDKAKAA